MGLWVGLELADSLVPLEHQDLRVIKVLLDLQEQQDNQEVLVLLVLLVLRDSQDHQVRQDNVDQRVSLAVKDLRETEVMMGSQVRLEDRGSLGPQGRLEMLGHQGPQERKDLKDQQVLLVIEVHLVHSVQ